MLTLCLRKNKPCNSYRFAVCWLRHARSLLRWYRRTMHLIGASPFGANVKAKNTSAWQLRALMGSHVPNEKQTCEIFLVPRRLHVSMRWGLCQNDWKRIQGPSCADLFLITTEFSQCYIWTSARLVCLAMTQNFRLLLVYGVCILFFWAKRSYTENMDPIDILSVLLLSWNWAMWNYMDAPFYWIPIWHSAYSIQSVNKVSPKRLPTVE